MWIAQANARPLGGSAWHTIRKQGDLADGLVPDAAMRAWLELLDGLEPAFARAFVASIRATVDQVSLGALMEGYAFGNVAAVEARINWQVLNNELQRRLARVMPGALEQGAALALTRLDDPTLSFNVLDPRVQERLATGSGVLIREVTAETRQAVRNAVARAYADGVGPATAARRIRQTIGLTQRQETAVASFRAGLSDAIAEGRSAASVRRRWQLARGVVRGDAALRPDRLEGLVAAYRERQIAYRATRIARTELTNAVTDGKWMAWQQAMDAGAVNRDVARLEWIVTPDERTCFPAGTFVGTGAGADRPIESIRVGDEVQTPAGLKPVVDIACKSYVGWLRRITVRDAADPVTCTPDHRFFAGAQWLEARDLKIGMQVQVFALGGRAILDIEDVSWDSERPVYDLQVHEESCYFANDVLVHNCQICLPNHGEQVAMGEAFPSGDTRPPAHVSCRCDVRMVRFPARARRTPGRELTDARVAEIAEARAVAEQGGGMAIAPTEYMVEAFNAGQSSRGVQDLMELSYADPRFDRWMEDDVQRLFWSAGHAGEDMPRWVQAERFGDIPLGGRSRNYADNYAEHGLSVARLLDGSDDYVWHMGGFGGANRPVVHVEGWLHYRRGADGEPLLVGARLLSG